MGRLFDRVAALEQVAGATVDIVAPAASFDGSNLTATRTRFTFRAAGGFDSIVVAAIDVVDPVIDPPTLTVHGHDRTRADVRLPVRPDMSVAFEFLENDNNGRVVLELRNDNLTNVTLTIGVVALHAKQRGRLIDLLLDRPETVEVR